MLLFGWSISASSALVCGLGLCCLESSFSYSIFRFFCSAISAAAVSCNGEASGDNAAFGDVDPSSFPRAGEVSRDLGRLRGFAGFRKLPASAARVLVEDAIDEGVSGRPVEATGSALGVKGT